MVFSQSDGFITNDRLLAYSKFADFELVKNNESVEYYNIPCALDIEATSYYDSYGDKRATMYIWTFGIFNWVTYGRTWVELTRLLEILSKVLELNSKKRLVCYVHNLSYDFQFFRKWLDWESVFLLDSRAPVKALSKLNIEFKCSLKLTGKSLAKVGDDLHKYKVGKMEGDLDYNLIRHSKTPLTAKELKYCENDIRVILSLIQEKIESDGDITRIPLTNTGYVRNFCRKKCYKKWSWKAYRSRMEELVIEESGDEYALLKDCFQGGFTHASHYNVNKTFSDVHSCDFTSSYPFTMVSEKRFPMSAGRKIILDKPICWYGKSSQLDEYTSDYCCAMMLEFNNIIPKLNNEHPISLSRCKSAFGYSVDNGRIIAAKQIVLGCTELDLEIYEKFYEWDYLEVKELYVYDRGYLPKDFILAILELYVKKTELKDVEGEEVLYMLSKNMLNSAYGMTVTDILRDILEYSNNEFMPKKPPDITESLHKYNTNVKRFLFYPWGVWVTALARRNLFTAIESLGRDYIYADTDSVKFLNWDLHKEYFIKYNEEVKEKLKESARFNKFDYSLFEPKTIKGKPKLIGVWDYEGRYDRFKTVGAKRYLVEKTVTKQDGTKSKELSLTLAGVNKKLGTAYLKTFDDPFATFRMESYSDEDLIFPAEYTGKKILTYFDEEFEDILVDYTGIKNTVYEKSYIHMSSTDYSMGFASDFRKYILGYKDVSY